MAPIKENLAAALLLAMKWPEMAKQGASFCDPLCGSGTFLIEALMIAADVAPQIKRGYFGFLGWKGHDNESWKALRADAVERARAGLAGLNNAIEGSDKSTHVIAQAEKNLQLSGFDRYINIRVGNITQINYATELKSGLVVCNPPYGVRLEKTADVPKLYTRLGRVFKRQFAGWTVGVFTGSPDLIHRMRLQTSNVIKCANGGIDCQLVKAIPEYSNETLEEADSAQVTASESQSPWNQSSKLSLPKKVNRAEMFANRLAKNFRGLEKWAKGEGISSYRVYDADLPEYAITVDVYESDKRYVHVQEYRAPSTIDRQLASQRLQSAMGEIPSVLNCEASSVILKERRREGDEQPRNRQENHIIEEQGCRFEIDFNDSLDTGIFSHHRKIRRWIFNKAKNKSFLNLFASTGTASVYAMAGGATSTTTIEMSKHYLGWAERNMALNTDKLEGHEFVLDDCFAWLAKPPNDKTYDLILLDPPSYTKNANTDQIWEVQRDHVKLIRQAITLLNPEGLLIFSSSARKLKIDLDRLDWHKVIDKSRASIPRDYVRTPKIHQCFFIQKKPQENA